MSIRDIDNALGWDRDGRAAEKNWAEKVGETLAWGFYELPRVVFPFLKDARTLIAGMTLSTLYCNTLIFYPEQTVNGTVRALCWAARNISWNRIRFAAWLGTEATILGIGLRGIGRLSNEELVRSWQPQRR